MQIHTYLKYFFLFVITTSMTFGDSLEKLRDLFKMDLFDQSAELAIELIHGNVSDEHKAECRYILHEIANKRKNQEAARYQKKLLLESFPNSSFAKKLKDDQQIDLQKKIQEHLEQDAEDQKGWEFFGIKSGMTNEEVTAYTESYDSEFQNFLKTLCLFYDSDYQSYHFNYSDNKVYSMDLEFSVSGMEGRYDSRNKAAQATALVFILQTIYPNAEISYGVERSGMKISVKNTDKKVEQEIQKFWFTKIANAISEFNQKSED